MVEHTACGPSASSGLELDGMTERSTGRATLPLRRVEENLNEPIDRRAWPASLAAVQSLLDGMDFGAATVLVGENGVGKSTLVEGVARAWGFPVEGGSTWEQRRAAGTDAPLARHLHLIRGAGAARRGFFLRAETMYGFAVHLSELGSERGHRLMRRSHGESFLDLLVGASAVPGLWILDEPESALSFQGQLALLSLLQERTDSGSQVILSTHSPLLARLPGADLWEAGDWGLRQRRWEDLDLVQHWRTFLDAPERYLRHL